MQHLNNLKLSQMLSGREDLQSGVGKDLGVAIYIVMDLGAASRVVAHTQQKSGARFRKELNGPVTGC